MLKEIRKFLAGTLQLGQSCKLMHLRQYIVFEGVLFGIALSWWVILFLLQSKQQGYGAAVWKRKSTLW